MAHGPRVRNEGQFFRELVDGLVHGFPVCCVAEYCSDILRKPNAGQARVRGVVRFRTFSVHPSESLFNGLDHVWKADHYVPCSECLRKHESAGRLVLQRNSGPMPSDWAHN